jgi:hypothetical protein
MGYDSGMRFGKLTLIEVRGINKSGNCKWLCLCNCGKKVIVSTNHLGSGHTKSCGCFANETRTKHGYAKTRIHKEWIGMRFRCSGKNKEDYPSHSGRGIKVCEGWNEFIIFKDWALSNGYMDNLTIDRIDNNKGYEPSNCRWIPKGEQARNQRRSIYLTHNNKTKLLIDWTREKGMKYSLTYPRYKRGWSFREIFS